MRCRFKYVFIFFWTYTECLSCMASTMFFLDELTQHKVFWNWVKIWLHLLFLLPSIYLVWVFDIYRMARVIFFILKNMAWDCDDFSNEFKLSEQQLLLATMALTLYVFNVCRRLNWDVFYLQVCLIGDFSEPVPVLVKMMITRKMLVIFLVIVGVGSAKFHHISTKMFSLKNF